MIIAFLSLAFASLACLSTSGAVIETPRPSQVATRFEVIEPTETAAATETQAIDSTVQICAVVVASEALHLRGTASLDGEVLTWLNSGDVVQVLDDESPLWWRVRSGNVEGFARSTFLINSECSDVIQ